MGSGEGQGMPARGPLDLAALRASGVPFSTAATDRAAAARDLWPRGTLDLRAGRALVEPAAVAWPRSRAEVRALLALARRTSTPVVTYGAGSGVCGAAAGMGDALVLDTKRMKAVIALDEDQGLVHVQPGILGQHLEDWLEARGWRTAHSPSSIMCSTAGGWAAARSAGQFSSRYGVVADMLVAAAMETPTGTLRGGAWAPTDAPDPLPLMLGSEGALGVFTDLVFRVHRAPAARWLRGYAFPTLEAAWEAMRRLMQAELWPSVLRLYDPVDTRIAAAGRTGAGARERPLLNRIRDAVNRMPGLRRHLLDVPLAMPRLLNRIADRIGDEVFLIVGFEGPEPLVAATVAAAAPLLGEARDMGAEPGERWFAHRHDVSYKLAPIFAAGGWADTMEVAASWSVLPRLHEQVRAAISDHAVVMAHFSHAYAEGCSIYFSFAGGGEREAYDACWAAALAAARAAGGTVTHHHGVGQLKAAAAAREAGAAVRLWHGLRSRVDPAGILNPGRLHPTLAPAPVPAEPEEAPPDPVVAPAAVPEDAGPVLGVDRRSLVARVRADAPVAAIEQALAVHGVALATRPDRPLGAWLAALRVGVLPFWQTPLLGIQARLPDGARAVLPGVPRSAAGPDLRQALCAAGGAEWVEVPVRSTQAPCVVVGAPSPAVSARLAAVLRPTWASETAWAFSGPLAAERAALVGTAAVSAAPPTVAPGPGLSLSPPADAVDPGAPPVAPVAGEGAP